MRIRDIMTQPAWSCRSHDHLATAAQLMWDHDCGAVPVIDDAGKVAGILTDRDVCMAAYTQGTTLTAIPVSRVMTTKVYSCRADDSVEAAERLMTDRQIRRIPIVDGEQRLVGFLSLNDVARHVAATRGKDGPERDVIRVLAAIGQPRMHGGLGTQAARVEH